MPRVTGHVLSIRSIGPRYPSRLFFTVISKDALVFNIRGSHKGSIKSCGSHGAGRGSQTGSCRVNHDLSIYLSGCESEHFVSLWHKACIAWQIFFLENLWLLWEVPPSSWYHLLFLILFNGFYFYITVAHSSHFNLSPQYYPSLDYIKLQLVQISVYWLKQGILCNKRPLSRIL